MDICFKEANYTFNFRVAALIKNGNKKALDYLINRYKELVNMKVSKYAYVDM